MWTVAIHLLAGVLAAVSIWLLIKIRDGVREKIRIEENAEYIRDLQIRAIDQLRQEVAALHNRILEVQHQEPPVTVSEPAELPEYPTAVSPCDNPDRSIPDIEGEPAAIAPTLISPLNDDKHILHEGVSSLKVVSVINYKGGVGKTTITSNIAAYAASEGKRVLMIDLDPQTNLTFSFMSSKEWEDKYAQAKTLKNFFRPIINGSSKRISLGSLVIPLEVQGLKMGLVSSHLELIDIDTDLAACLGGANINIMNRNFLRVHSHLRDGLSKLKNDYDLVLIDCPPNFNTVVKNAITASDYYLVPAKMDYLSTLGIEQLDRNTRKYVKSHNDYVAQIGEGEDEFSRIAPAMLGVVPTMLTMRDGPIQANQHYIDQVKSQGYYLFPWLRENSTLYAPAPQNGIPVILSSLPATTTGQGVLEELRSLSKDFMKKVGF